MNRAMMVLLLLLPAFAAAAPDTETVLERYQQALHQQDSAALERLISPDARIRLLLEQPGKAPLVLTLTRQEYLQQLRALWRFSESENYEISDTGRNRADGATTVTLTLRERYELFGEALNRHSAMTLWVNGDKVTPPVMRIEAHVREW